MKDSLMNRCELLSLAWIYLGGALIMAVLRPQSFRHITSSFTRGIIVGLLLGTGYIFQTFGLTLQLWQRPASSLASTLSFTH
jgi:hypothetical protein